MTKGNDEMFLGWPDEQEDDGLHSQENEMAALGALINENILISRAPNLKPQHFAFKIHQDIFESIISIIEDGDIVNPVRLAPMFRNASGLPDGMDGFTYLMKCVEYGRDTLSVVFIEHVRVVVDLYNRREALRYMQDAIKKIKDVRNHKTTDIVVDLTGSIMDLEEVIGADFHSYKQVTGLISKDMKQKLSAVPTGIAKLDSSMGGGFYPRMSYYFAAEKKMGKTTLLGTLSMNVAKAGVPVLYIAAEMGEKQINQRNVARELNKNSMSFLTNKDDQEFQRLVVEHFRGVNYPLYFLDLPGISFSQLRLLVNVAVNKFNIQGFFLDYLGLVSGNQKGENDAQFQERVCEWISNTCKKRNIWSATAAQLNREGQIRGSSGAEMNCDQLYVLIKDGKEAYMKQKLSRYTPTLDCGTEEKPALKLHNNGPHFKDIDETYDGYETGEGSVYSAMKGEY